MQCATYLDHLVWKRGTENIPFGHVFKSIRDNIWACSFSFLMTLRLPLNLRHTLIALLWLHKFGIRTNSKSCLLHNFVTSFNSYSTMLVIVQVAAFQFSMSPFKFLLLHFVQSIISSLVKTLLQMLKSVICPEWVSLESRTSSSLPKRIWSNKSTDKSFDFTVGCCVDEISLPSYLKKGLGILKFIRNYICK